MMLIKLFSLAGTLESGALLLASSGDVTMASFAPFFTLHLAASAVLSIPVWACLPASMRAPKLPVMALLFIGNVFAPSLPVLMLLATRMGIKYRQLHKDAPVSVIREPQYSMHRNAATMRSRGGRTRSKLTNTFVPVSDRLTALLAIQETPARVSADLLRQLLADPVEDIRLLAYGMLDGKEKGISVRILAEEGKLEKAQESEAAYGCHKRLAELHWELVYQCLVQGDMKGHSCREARKHANAAIAMTDTDAGLWFLLMRIAMTMNESEQAIEALSHAEALGFEREQLLPFQAELAYMQRRYSDIPALFSSARSVPNSIRLAAVYKFWTNQ